MKELFYFAFADLMVRVEYDKKANSLRYASHRQIASAERMIVEQYLLSSVATKTDYYKKRRSQFIYLGMDAQLAKYLSIEKERDITASVEGLINQSMQNYYFEQIGDAILTMRQELRTGDAQARVAPVRQRMEELVKAYNQYAEQKVSVADVTPSELQPHFGFSVQPRMDKQSRANEKVI